MGIKSTQWHSYSSPKLASYLASEEHNIATITTGKMKIVILCQALLAFATLTAALPTPLQSTPTPDASQQLPLDFPDSEVELLNSDQVQSNEDLKPFENPDLFEGDIIISPEEIELYYSKQNNTHVRLKTYTSLTYSLLCGEIHIQIQNFILIPD